jgi:DNA-binding response OmpR family regulator
MAVALLCAQRALETDLGHTMLWRHDLERHHCDHAGPALALARTLQPDLVLVDSALEHATQLVWALRNDPSTSKLPVAVLTRETLDELSFLDAGAIEVLKLPATPEWDERLLRLIRMPVRKQARFDIAVEVEANDTTGRAVRVRGVNLSATGMLLESNVPMRIGDQFRLNFRLPGSAAPVTGTAWVVREAGPARFGVEFLYLEADGLERVRHLVQ